MSTLLSADTFNRADNASSLGSTDGAGTADPAAWTIHSGGFGILSNTADYKSGTGLASIDLGAADVDLTVDMTNATGNNGILFRYTTTSNYWVAYIGGAQMTLRRRSGGTNTDTNFAVASGVATIRIVALGDDISIYRNGVLVGSTTDAHNNTATRHGLYLVGGAHDNWSASTAELSITAALLTNAPTFFAPAVVNAQNITAAFLSATPTFFSPAVTFPGQIAPELLDASPTFFDPAIAGSSGLVGALLDASPEFFSPSVGQPSVPAGADVPEFAMRRVDISSGNPLSLPSAQPEDIVWTLNEPTEAVFSFPKQAYTQTQIPTLASETTPHEYLIFYDDVLKFRGPMIAPAAVGSQGAVVCQCADVLWICNRLNIDAPQDNHLTNPEFESGMAEWTAVGGITAAASSARKILGTQSARLSNSTPNDDTYITQSFRAGPNGVGLLLTVVGYFFIESIGAPAGESRGLYVEGGRDGTVEKTNYYAIDEATDQNEWVRAELTIHIPPNQTWDLEVRCYAPQGVIFWDAVAVYAMDSTGAATITGSASEEADIASIAGVLVRHVQSAIYGKRELHMGKNTPANGVRLFRQYQYVEHIGFADAISEFTDRDDGFDISVEVTPTTKSFNTWTPEKGTDRSAAVTLKFVQGADDNNCVDYRYSRSGDGCITRETFTGQGDGPDREQGEYADTSQVGGLVFQEVRAAPADTSLNSLLPLAREVVKKRLKPPVLVEFDIRPDAGLINVLEVGDRVDIALDDGYAELSGTFRIVKLRLNCRSRVLTAYVNETEE